MARPIQPCPKCKKEKPLTRHHVFPVRVYGRKDNEEYFYLCRECHTKLEETIPFEPVKKYLYPLFVLRFLQEGI